MLESELHISQSEVVVGLVEIIAEVGVARKERPGEPRITIRDCYKDVS